MPKGYLFDIKRYFSRGPDIKPELHIPIFPVDQNIQFRQKKAFGAKIAFFYKIVCGGSKEVKMRGGRGAKLLI